MLFYLFLVFPVISAFLPSRDSYPQIIAHRGASGYLPEHSLGAYQLAMDLLTDYIEPDLCVSKDGVLVAMHDLLLDDTTDVATSQYADRKSTKIVDGVEMTGYFVCDFLYSELLDLRLKQRISSRTTQFNGLFQIPSFAQIMSMAQSHFASSGRLVGLYPELKHPAFHNSLVASLGWPARMEDMLLASLAAGGFAVSGPPAAMDKVQPAVIQCFEQDALVYLKNLTTIPLIFLLNAVPDSYWTQSNLEFISSFADGIGPDKVYFGSAPYKNAKNTVQLIHDNNLYIHPWTFRADQDIGFKFKNDFLSEEMYYFCCLGIDAVFSEFPDRSRDAIGLMTNYTFWKENYGNKKMSKCDIKCE